MRTKKPVVNRNNTIVIGRSIGSGGATYLACNKKMKNLILISPFSKDFVGCVGGCFKCHFNNLEEL